MAQWIRVAKKQDVPDGSGVVSEAAGKTLAVFNIGGDFYVTDNVCPHRGGPLGEGDLEGSVVTCPWHGWTFDVIKGCHSENEKVKLQTFSVKVEEDNVLVEVE